MVNFPSFRKTATRSSNNNGKPVSTTLPSNGIASTTTAEQTLTKAQIKRATKTRKTFSLLTSIFLFLAVIFLILVEVGSIRNQLVLRDIYFLRLNLQNVIPNSIPNARLLNSIAQTLGLHDFYTVGLWGFCSGYADSRGTTFCSSPQTLYWFNPVEILRNELIAGATISLPANVNQVLDIIRFASNWMFVFFLLGACLSSILILAAPFSVFTRWATLPIALLALFNACVVVAASTIATVMFVIFRNVVQSVAELNIEASLGTRIFALMWIASAFAVIAAVTQLGLLCCCASRRDVRNGRKRGSSKAYTMNEK